MPEDYRLDPKPCTVRGDANIADAMRRMTETGVGIVLVAGADGRLEGVVVDSDLRRALIADPDMGQPLARVMNRNPDTLPAGLGHDDLKARTRDVVHPYMPLADGAGRVAGLIRVWALQHGDSRLPNAAVIMAGGRGERLRPLTADRPKPMVEVGERPILETIVGHLSAAGIGRIYLAVNYLAERIEAHFGDGARHGVAIEYLREETPRGTAGALADLAGRESEPLLVMNGDILTRLSPRSLFEFHRQEDADATMAVRSLRVDIPYGVVEIDGGSMVAIDEKPTSNHYVSAGIYAIAPGALDLVPAGRPFDMPDLLNAIHARRRGSVACFPVPEYWTDVGQEEDLQKARDDFKMTFEG